MSVLFKVKKFGFVQQGTNVNEVNFFSHQSVQPPKVVGTDTNKHRLKISPYAVSLL